MSVIFRFNHWNTIGGNTGTVLYLFLLPLYQLTVCHGNVVVSSVLLYHMTSLHALSALEIGASWLLNMIWLIKQSSYFYNRLNYFQFIQLQMFIIDFLNRHGLFDYLTIIFLKLPFQRFYTFTLCWRQIMLFTNKPNVRIPLIDRWTDLIGEMIQQNIRYHKLISTVTADVLAPDGASPSAGTVVTSNFDIVISKVSRLLMTLFNVLE